jgi:hypothetical protein
MHLRKKRWEDTLRGEENVSLRLVSSDQKKCVSQSKQKRYYHYDWGKLVLFE